MYGISYSGLIFQADSYSPSTTRQIREDENEITYRALLQTSQKNVEADSSNDTKLTNQKKNYKTSNEQLLSDN